MLFVKLMQQGVPNKGLEGWEQAEVPRACQNQDTNGCAWDGTDQTLPPSAEEARQCSHWQDRQAHEGFRLQSQQTSSLPM